MNTTKTKPALDITGLPDGVTATVVDAQHGFTDLDIEGIAFVCRLAIPDSVTKYDCINCYMSNSRKYGVPWLGTVSKTIAGLINNPHIVAAQTELFSVPTMSLPALVAERAFNLSKALWDECFARGEVTECRIQRAEIFAALDSFNVPCAEAYEHSVERALQYHGFYREAKAHHQTLYNEGLPTHQQVMSSQAYAEAGGNVCPHCGSDQTEGGSADVDGGAASSDARCLVCHASWRDLYKLVGYESLEMA